MNARSLLLCVLLCAATASQSRPGRVSVRLVAIPDDVPAHLCSALAQNRQGFLWIGTHGGLVRFDGYHFRTIGNSHVRVLLAARGDETTIKTTLGMWYQAFDRSLTQDEVSTLQQQLATRLADMLPVKLL